VVICLKQGADDLHVVQRSCHCHSVISCFIKKIQIGLRYLVPAYPGCPGKETVQWVSCQLLLITC